jgi:hypothetical protein
MISHKERKKERSSEEVGLCRVTDLPRNLDLQGTQMRQVRGAVTSAVAIRGFHRLASDYFIFLYAFFAANSACALRINTWRNSFLRPA